MNPIEQYKGEVKYKVLGCNPDKEEFIFNVEGKICLVYNIKFEEVDVEGKDEKQLNMQLDIKALDDDTLENDPEFKAKVGTCVIRMLSDHANETIQNAEKE